MAWPHLALATFAALLAFSVTSPARTQQPTAKSTTAAAPASATPDLAAALHKSPATLLHVRDIRSLTPEQASQSSPLLIRGVLTAFVGAKDFFFVQDETGGICVDLRRNHVAARGSSELQVGDRIEISGYTDPGLFAPIIVASTTAFLGRGQLPTPKRLKYLEMVRGDQDSQWIEVEGVVRSATAQVNAGEQIVSLNVDLGGGNIAVRLQNSPADYRSLVDAQVRVRGVCGTIFNNKKQIVGLRMWTPGTEDLNILQLAPADPATYHIQAVRSVMQFGVNSREGHRVKVSGVVTYQDQGHNLYLQDAANGISIQTPQNTSVAPGTRVEAVGFPSTGQYSPMLKDALFRVVGSAPPVQPVSTDADHVFEQRHELMMAPYDSQLIQLRGEVVERLSQSGEWVWIVRNGKSVFEVHAKQAAFNTVDNIRPGSVFLFTGVCTVQVDGEKVPQSFRLLLRSPNDLILLQGASRWTRNRILLILGLVAAATLFSLLGVFVLGRRVKEQTHVIRTSEERFRYLAQHDGLTGLANRLLLNDRIEVALTRSERFSSGVALLLLDIDNFKHVNDSLGHGAGDQLLCLASSRIAALVRSTDTVARMGGDEFVVLFTDLTDDTDVEAIAIKILASLAAPMQLNGQEVVVSGSAGIAVFPEGGVEANTLIQNADIAMYQAKARGRNGYEFFTPTMASAKVDKLALQMALARALERDEFHLQYQPMVDFSTGKVTGFEALLRWHSKKLGLVMPDHFIPLAEQTGLIVSIGEWVLHEASRQVAQLEKECGRSFLLAVNVSPRQVEQGNLPRVIEQVLARSGRPACTLEIELTESVLMDDSPRAVETLKQIRDMGVRLAIDDFGVGFSSLSYIMRFAINRIKIDRSFIVNCTLDRNSNTVARTLIAMARGLDIEVVAEGIEGPEHYAFLRAEQCDTAQGYYISRPVDADDIPATLERWEKTIRGQYRLSRRPLTQSPSPWIESHQREYAID